MRPPRQSACMAIMGAALVLGGCDIQQRIEAFIDGDDTPEEFRVISRAPLSLPPDYNLRPPRPGASRPQEIEAKEKARRTVFRADGGTGESILSQRDIGRPGVSPGEAALLRRAGIDDTPDNIREQVNQETGENANSDADFSEQLIFWRRGRTGADNTVNAEAEAARIRARRAGSRADEAPRRGEAPRGSEDTEDKGLLERLF